MGRCCVTLLGLCFWHSHGSVLGGADMFEKGPLAGWLGVFPELNGYQRTFAAPVMDSAKNRPCYKQLAKYEWTGGAFKILKVTVARDPAFKQNYAEETLRKGTPPPKEVALGQRTGWLWDLQKVTQDKPNGVHQRLVVPLAADKALHFDAHGAGPWEDLVGLARQFDLAGIGAALDKPPRTDFLLTVETFRVFKKGTPYADVLAWAGEADRISNGEILVYDLPKGARVQLVFDKARQLLHARLESNGTIEELIK